MGEVELFSKSTLVNPNYYRTVYALTDNYFHEMGAIKKNVKNNIIE